MATIEILEAADRGEQAVNTNVEPGAHEMAADINEYCGDGSPREVATI